MSSNEEDFDFLGIPSPTEMWMHYASSLSDEVAELNRQLFQARKNLDKLVKMHAQALDERDKTRAQLRVERERVSALDQEVTTYNYKMMALERKNQQLLMENEVLSGRSRPAILLQGYSDISQ